MELDTKDIKKISLMIVILILGVLTFFLLRPVLLSIIAGLILAYIFTPVYNRITPFIKNRSLVAWIVAIVVIVIIITPLWFITPLMLQQVFDVFTFTQEVELGKAVQIIFPTANTQFISQMTLALNSFSNKIVAAALGSLNSFILELPIISLHIILALFVFFYALKDGKSLREFAEGLSPFSKSKEKLIVQNFKDITDSVVYGQIIVGIVQGSLAGLGLLIFGVGNVIVLTFLAIFLSLLPILGPFLIWIPVTVYLFVTGDTGTAIGFLLYNLLIVSTVDNVLRTYLISRKTRLSPAIVLVGMVGGLLVFGVLGLLLGPLIIAYFLMLLNSYKDKTLYNLITEEQ
ncbi:MAG: AI-2E family transporter [Nanoarchaeota archaeon]